MSKNETNFSCYCKNSKESANLTSLQVTQPVLLVFIDGVQVTRKRGSSSISSRVGAPELVHGMLRGRRGSGGW